MHVPSNTVGLRILPESSSVNLDERCMYAQMDMISRLSNILELESPPCNIRSSSPVEKIPRYNHFLYVGE